MIKYFIYTLLAVLVFAMSSTPVYSAINCSTVNGGTSIQPTLEAARIAPTCASRTVTVTSELTPEQSNITDAWPSDRTLAIATGGSINNTTAFSIGAVTVETSQRVFTGNGAVIGMKESRPEWFTNNAVPGVTDMTSAMQSAVNAATGGVVHLSNTTYLVSNVYINKPVSIVGLLPPVKTIEGSVQSGTRILAKASTTGAVITIAKGTTHLDYENQLYGVKLKSFMLDGNNRDVLADAIKMISVDYSVLEDLTIYDFKYSAINMYTAVRESRFNRIHTRYCGSIDDDKPTLDMREHSTTDGHNLNAFTSCSFIYSYGNSLMSGSFRGIFGDPRDNTFISCVFHGLVPAMAGMPYTVSPAQKALKHVVFGKVGKFDFIGCTFYAAGDATPHIHLTTDAVTGSTRINVIGGTFAGHYGYTGNYDGVLVEAGTLTVSGASFIGNNHPVRQTGGNVYLDPTCDIRQSADVYTGLIANVDRQLWGVKDISLLNGSISDATKLSTTILETSVPSLPLIVKGLSAAPESIMLSTPNGSAILVGGGAARNGDVIITPVLRLLSVKNLSTNEAALAAGLVVGDVYQDNGVLKIVY